MIYSKKLKPDRDVTGLLPVIFALLVSGVTAVISGLEIGIKALGAIFFIYALFAAAAVYRTRNIGYIFSTAYLFFAGIYLTVIGIDENRRNIFIQTPISKLFLILTLFTLGILLFLLFTKRTKWRGREILEYAAINVEEGPDSYTDRPRPIMKGEYSRDELLNFAEFIKRNLIAMPFYEQERILFVPVRMGQEYYYLFSNNIKYWDKTWVAFDFDGNVSAHISKKDYLEYKKNLDFDSLCGSLGKLFVEFIEDMKKKEEIRIIDKLNEMKTGFFS